MAEITNARCAQTRAPSPSQTRPNTTCCNSNSTTANTISCRPSKMQYRQNNHQQHLGEKKMPKILRNFEAPKEIRDIIDQSRKDKEFENSIRMFVLLSDGEQRFITFRTPEEDCTIEEMLDQFGLTYAEGTKIFVNEYNKYGINLVVSVGFEDDDEEEPKPAQPRAAKRPVTSPAKAPSPILPPVEESPKLIACKMGLCGNCGFRAVDFNKCQRCRRKMPGIYKTQTSRYLTHSAHNTKRTSSACQKKHKMAEITKMRRNHEHCDQCRLETEPTMTWNRRRPLLTQRVGPYVNLNLLEQNVQSTT